MKGKFVLIPFPFTNLASAKLRPALVLYEGKDDVIVLFVSSKVPQEPARYEVVIEQHHPEYTLTGLKVSSVVRIDKVATVLKSLIVGEIGELGPSFKDEVNLRLGELFKF
ncbi:MAG: type II toxin-antitoxin system PemK/MazF family toxin [Thaumarchaeota archaeon]|nr:type II toxin-antitoxin system PemK/MazF family toxin [Nitrososphaerota archaeon]MCL5316768.1 type II toxin-antitoxin system PemK/MazF family toxin [Nitrososphaerota archaeon]